MGDKDGEEAFHTSLSLQQSICRRYIYMHSVDGIPGESIYGSQLRVRPD